jgi:hypothetical protein
MGMAGCARDMERWVAPIEVVDSGEVRAWEAGCTAGLFVQVQPTGGVLEE